MPRVFTEKLFEETESSPAIDTAVEFLIPRSKLARVKRYTILAVATGQDVTTKTLYDDGTDKLLVNGKDAGVTVPADRWVIIETSEDIPPGDIIVELTTSDPAPTAMRVRVMGLKE